MADHGGGHGGGDHGGGGGHDAHGGGGGHGGGGIAIVGALASALFSAQGVGSMISTVILISILRSVFGLSTRQISNGAVTIVAFVEFVIFFVVPFIFCTVMFWYLYGQIFGQRHIPPLDRFPFTLLEKKKEEEEHHKEHVDDGDEEEDDEDEIAAKKEGGHHPPHH